jgi:hypothetical protein
MVAWEREDFIFSSGDEVLVASKRWRIARLNRYPWLTTPPPRLHCNDVEARRMLISAAPSTGFRELGVVRTRREQDAQSGYNLLNVAQIAGIHFVQYHSDLRADRS